MKRPLAYALGLLVAYALVASIVFQFRHPWMTETERFVYLPRALAFGSVDYAEARTR